MAPGETGVGKLVVVFGDQLNLDSAAFDDFNKARDLVWMAEVDAEAEHVWSSKARIAIFLSGMRHFRAALEKRGFNVLYRRLDDPNPRGDLDAELSAAISERKPALVVAARPGAYRIERMLIGVARRCGAPLELRPDRTFLCSPDQFADHIAGRKRLRMEYFYREMRRRHNVLLDKGKPVGGKWNYDARNRRRFGKVGPGEIPPPRSFSPDSVTAEVLRLVDEQFASHPGSLASFDWPVTAVDAEAALADFIEHRLGLFGDYEDAMWTGEPYLYHSRLSAALNLKLLSPSRVIEAAAEAWAGGAAAINSVEGFVRQILGWREYVRGIYWQFMPGYIDRNALDADGSLPAFYWTGDTDALCLRSAIGQTLKYGYAHHIQRLMVTGLFALLAGVEPRQVHRWYLAVYVDAVEWVELPNTLGMSQFADGGVMASKPYCATGKYIHRMSNYCRKCRFRPGEAVGDDACPFTTLYWDFLLRHRSRLDHNARMGLQLRNLSRLNRTDRITIRRQANVLLDSL